ncbi:MAG: MBL fold metallo-hydrolase [Dehalococcoidia bacterium]|nr:MBL fold metallo-hydrolase [Dehalococcoidia bacterium]
MEQLEDLHILRIPMPDNPLGCTLVYLIAGPEGHTLIDTGWDWPNAYESLVDQMDQLGLDVKDVRQIVLTHMHPDHVGLANQIRQVSGAKVIAHQDDTPTVRNREMRAHPPFATHGIPRQVSDNSRFTPDRHPRHNWPELDELLGGGEVIRAGNLDLEVIWTPGHAAGHICLYDRTNKVLFSGDHVLPVITSHISLLWDSRPNRDPLGDYLTSLDKLKPLDVETVYPAHEYTFYDLQGRLAELDHHHEQRLLEMTTAIDGNWATAFDVAKKIVWAIGSFDMLEDSMKLLATGETLAHLEFLHLRGELTKKENSGVVFYGGTGC